MEGRKEKKAEESLLPWSLALQSLKRMQGPMLAPNSFALEQRHGRSEVVQLIAVAAVSRQGRAHVGSMLTMLAMPVPVEAAGEAVVLVVCARA